MLGVLALAAIAVYFIFGGMGPNAANPTYLQSAMLGKGSTLLSISDAPSIYNISGVYVAVNSVSLHSAADNRWYSIGVNGTFNLLLLRNTSQVLASVNVSKGFYDELVLSVRNITVGIDGRNESAAVPSNEITIMGNVSITNGTNWINFDFNLAKSLHIESNGGAVFTPVINLKHRTGAALAFTSGNIVVVRSSGNLERNQSYGMGLDGRMRSDFAVAQNMSLNVAEGGGIAAIAEIPAPLLISGGGRLVIISNASQALNETVSVRNEGTAASATSINASKAKVDCNVEIDAVYCNSNATPNITQISEAIRGIRKEIGSGTSIHNLT